jgi:hypothetical protein
MSAAFAGRSTLLDAEVRAVCEREHLPRPEYLIAEVDWIHPDRRLTVEIDQCLAVGYLRGADLFHLACALYIANPPSGFTFLTLDKQQRAIAETLGFVV